MKIYTTKELGAQIRNRRKKLGYTQAYIAEYTGLSASFISQVENGKDTAEILKVIKLLNILGMDMIVEER